MTKAQLQKIEKVKTAIKHGEKSEWVSYNTTENTVTLINSRGTIGYKLHADMIKELAEDIHSNKSAENLVNSALNNIDYVEKNITVEEVKAFKKQSRAEHPRANLPFQFEHNGKKYGFNPDFFIEIMTVMGRNTTIYIHNYNTLKPLCFKSDIGEAVLLPVRIKD